MWVKDIPILIAMMCVCVLFPRYTKLGFAGNTEPQFIMPSGKQKGRGVGDIFDPNLTNFIPITSP